MFKLEKFIINPSDYVIESIIKNDNSSTTSVVHLKDVSTIKLNMKTIPIEGDDEYLQKCTMREILVMRELNHPCLVKLSGFSLPSNIDHSFKIFTQYYPNKTLLEALKSENNDGYNKINNTQKSIIIYGIASAMSYLHKNNIVHRGLKPENVLLNSQYEPVITNFGFSKIYSNGATMSTRIGTPYFMAPELFCEDDRNDEITNKIDVYSFGITLLTFFTTKYQFKGMQPRSIDALANYIKNGKHYQIPENTPQFYKDLISKCWQMEADQRPSFDEIVNLFESNDDFLFSGADKEKVTDFIVKVKNEIDKPQLYSTSSQSSFLNENDGTELTSSFKF